MWEIRVRLALLAMLCTATSLACASHYRNAIPLSDAQLPEVLTGLAIAGTLENRRAVVPKPLRVGEATARLAAGVGVRDLSSTVATEELQLLLAAPAQLRLRRDELADLRQRLGCRYIVAAELAEVPVRWQKRWVMEMIVPVGYTIVVFPIPITYSHKYGIPHTSLEVRVVDLEGGEIVGESYEVLRSESLEGSLGGREVQRALDAIRLAEVPAPTRRRGAQWTEE